VPAASYGVYYNLKVNLKSCDFRKFAADKFEASLLLEVIRGLASEFTC
jgi:hypothetical protein